MDNAKEAPAENSAEGGNNGESKGKTLHPVTPAALASLLVRKGICTEEELQAEEETLRQKMFDEIQTAVRTRTARGERPPTTPDFKEIKNNRRVHQNSSWLRRKMSKRRWTRRVGSALFGWEWKKVKVRIDQGPGVAVDQFRGSGDDGA